jgi:hypothetical protein
LVPGKEPTAEALDKFFDYNVATVGKKNERNTFFI